MTQQSLIARLRKGWISSAQAFSEFGTLKLTSRISELRASGVKVQSRQAKARGKVFNEYRIAR